MIVQLTCAGAEIPQACTAHLPVRSVSSRAALEANLNQASAAVVSVPTLGDEEVGWLREMFASRGGTPACVVVVPLSIGAVQRLRTLRSDCFHSVWAEEIRERLATVVERVTAREADPLRILGRRIIGTPGIRQILSDVVSHICRLPFRLSPSPQANVARRVAERRLAKLALIGRLGLPSHTLQLCLTRLLGLPLPRVRQEPATVRARFAE